MSVLIRLLEQRFFSKIALICFLLTLPLSIRKVFFVFPPYGTSGFNEYTDISLYLSDLTSAALLLFILLENKNIILSIKFWKKMFHVEHVKNRDDQYINVPRGTFELEQGFCWYKCSTWNNLAYILLLPLPFVLWGTLSIFWSENEMLAVYASIRLFFGYFLYLGLTFLIVPRGTLVSCPSKNMNCSTWNNKGELVADKKLFHVEQSDDLFRHVPRGTIKKRLSIFYKNCSTWNILNIVSVTFILSGFIQSIIAIGQFISQSSLQLTFLWESQFSGLQAGVAKVILLDQVFIRSYGLFPHPNILAAFLAVTIILTLRQSFVFHQKLFHLEQLDLLAENVPRGTLNRSRAFLPNFLNAFNSFLRNGERMFHVEHSVCIVKIALIVQVFGIFSTFSKGAILGLLISLIYIFYKLVSLESSAFPTNIVPRGTLNRSNWVDRIKCFTWKKWSRGVILFHVEHISDYIRVLIFGIVAGFLINTINWHFFLIQPIKERFILQQWAFSLLKDNPILGSGIAQSVYLLQNFASEKLAVWQFQPVHNVFLLISAELGTFGCLLFIVTLYIAAKRMFHVEHLHNTFVENIDSFFFAGLGIVLLVTSFFDHYYWDIQQGQILFWFILSLVVSLGVLKSNLTKVY